MKSDKPVRSRRAIGLIVSCTTVLAIVAGVILYVQESAYSRQEVLRRKQALYSLAQIKDSWFSSMGDRVQFGFEDPTSSLRNAIDRIRVWLSNLVGQPAPGSRLPLRLHTLMLANTQATDEDLAHLATFPELRRLRLGHSAHHFTDRGLVHLKGLHNLTHLDLTGQAVTHIGLQHLKHLPSLELLNLTSVPVTDEGLAQLSGLQNLKSLALDASNVTEVGLIHLSKLKNLKHLYLWGWGNSAESKGLDHLSKLNLNLLNLMSAKLTDAEIAHLGELKSLRALDLCFTNMTDSGLVHLSELTNLECLALTIDPKNTDVHLQQLSKKLHPRHGRSNRERLRNVAPCSQGVLWYVWPETSHTEPPLPNVVWLEKNQVREQFAPQ